jgi:tetratricopeptide (TPR) repeat protein
MSCSLTQFWELRGSYEEGHASIERAFAAADGTGMPPELRVRALNCSACLAGDLAEYDVARERFREGAALARSIGDRVGLSQILNNAANIESLDSNPGVARDLHEEGLAIAREIGEPFGIAMSLNNLGRAFHGLGDLDSAGALYQESLDIRRAREDRAGIAQSLNNLAALALDEGDHERARTLAAETLPIAREFGRGLELSRSLEILALAAAAGGDDAVRAATLLGTVEALREQLRVPFAPAARPRYDALGTALRETMGDEEFERARAAGRAMPLERALALALEPSSPG